MAAPVSSENMPTTASYVFATAILAGVVGFFVGQGASLGLFSSPATATSQQKKKINRSDNREKDDEEDEDDSDDDEEEDEVEDNAELATFEGNNDEVKLVLVVRTDLGMGKGKNPTLHSLSYFIHESDFYLYIPVVIFRRANPFVLHVSQARLPLNAHMPRSPATNIIFPKLQTRPYSDAGNAVDKRKLRCK